MFARRPANCTRRMARAEYDPADLPPSIAERLAPAQEQPGQHRTESKGEPAATNTVGHFQNPIFYLPIMLRSDLVVLA